MENGILCILSPKRSWFLFTRVDGMVESYTNNKSTSVPGHSAQAINVSLEKTQTRALSGNLRACSDIQQSQQVTFVVLGSRGQGLRQVTELLLSLLLCSCSFAHASFKNKNLTLQTYPLLFTQGCIDLIPNKGQFWSLIPLGPCIWSKWNP